jgi:hypothetical protein
MICDGCRFPFDPASLHYRPAALWRRAIGWSLLVLGGLLLLGASRVALTRLPIHDTGFFLVGLFLLPAVAIFGGSALIKGKVMADESSSGPAAPLPEGKTGHQEPV